MASNNVNETRQAPVQQATVTVEDCLLSTDEALYHLGLISHQMASLAQKGRNDLAPIRTWCMDVEQKQRSCTEAYKTLVYKQRATAAELDRVKLELDAAKTTHGILKSELASAQADREILKAKLEFVTDGNGAAAQDISADYVEVGPSSEEKSLTQLEAEIAKLKDEYQYLEKGQNGLDVLLEVEENPQGTVFESTSQVPVPDAEDDADAKPLVQSLKRSRNPESQAQGASGKKSRKRKAQK